MPKNDPMYGHASDLMHEILLEKSFDLPFFGTRFSVKNCPADGSLASTDCIVRAPVKIRIIGSAILKALAQKIMLYKMASP